LCYEICGDGKNLFSYECDDNNVISGDGCSAGCKVELGFKCVGGSPTTKDVCTEICGDGMPRGVLGCDDGNLVNGDGCDKTCTVEYGWKCFSPNKIVSSFCYKISWPNIVDFWLANGNNNLYIKFNETIAVDKNWNETDWSLSIDGPVGPYNFTWDLY
jgi:cysteine-rich repeat protein